MAVSIDIRTNGADKAAQEINNVAKAENNLANETVQASSKIVNAKKEEAGWINKIAELRKEDKKDARLQNFVAKQSAEMFGVGAMALSMFGMASEGASASQKKLSGALSEGFMAFQGLEFAMTAIPYGGFIAGAIGAGIALNGLFTVTEEEKNKLKELENQLDSLNLKLGNVSAAEYGKKLAEETKAKEQEVIKFKNERLGVEAQIIQTEKMLSDAVARRDGKEQAAIALTLEGLRAKQRSMADIKTKEKEVEEKQLAQFEFAKTQRAKEFKDIADKEAATLAVKLSGAKTQEQKDRITLESKLRLNKEEEKGNLKIVSDLMLGEELKKDIQDKAAKERDNITTGNIASENTNRDNRKKAAIQSAAENLTISRNADEAIKISKAKTEVEKEDIRHQADIDELNAQKETYAKLHSGDKEDINLFNAGIDAKIEARNRLYKEVNTPEAKKKDDDKAEGDKQKEQAKKESDARKALTIAEFVAKQKIYANERAQRDGDLDAEEAKVKTQAVELGQSVADVEAKYRSIRKKNAEADRQEDKQKEIEKITSLAELAGSTASTVAQTLGDIASAQHKNNIDNLDREKTDKLGAIDAEIEAAGNDEKLKAELVKKRKETETEMNKKIADEKGKAWDAEHAAALTMAAINGAVAVTKAWAVMGPLGFVGAAITTAATVAQIGIIASQKKPKFHTGGIIGDEPLQANERLIIGQVGEAVVTKKQMNDMSANGGSQAKNLTINFNSPVTETEMVTRAIRNVLYETGQTIDKVFVNSGNRSMN